MGIKSPAEPRQHYPCSLVHRAYPPHQITEIHIIGASICTHVRRKCPRAYMAHQDSLKLLVRSFPSPLPPPRTRLGYFVGGSSLKSSLSSSESLTSNGILETQPMGGQKFHPLMYQEPIHPQIVQDHIKAYCRTPN